MLLSGLYWGLNTAALLGPPHDGAALDKDWAVGKIMVRTTDLRHYRIVIDRPVFHRSPMLLALRPLSVSIHGAARVGSSGGGEGGPGEDTCHL